MRYIFFIYLFVLPIFSKAQLVDDYQSGILFDKNINVPSSGLGINKSLFTGTENISVPFYKYSLAQINDLGVSIGYNTQGIKVDRLASNFGLGWELYTPYGVDLNEYNAYIVNQSLPMMRSIIMPWFGQPGGGIQYYSTLGNTSWLIQNGYISPYIQQ